MLAYAANARPAGRRNSPATLALILGAHALVIGLVIHNKTVVEKRDGEAIKLIPVAPIKPPPPEPVPPQPDHAASTPFTPPSPVPIPLPNIPIVTTAIPGAVVIDPVPGKIPAVTPYVPPTPLVAAPVRRSAVLLTTGDDLVPPYPEARRDGGVETTLRLLLDIDARGRVVAVTPSGPADPVFLEAGRRHILSHWRYRPASEDGRAVPTRTTITLLFRLED